MAHYHFKMRRVCAEPGRNKARDKSAYIRRCRERDIRVRTPVVCASSYMRRQEELEEAKGEVLYAELLLPSGVDMSRDELWDAVDRAARRKDGQYKQHAGHMPCLAIFSDASLPWGLAPETAIEATRSMARWLVDSYNCGVETAIHIKDGKIDHAHFLFTDRQLTPDGVGQKIRGMNGIADRSTEVEGGRRVAAFAEAARAEWARLTRLASNNDKIDHRSFARQGRDDAPCRDIPRAQYEYEIRHGITTSRDERKAMLAARAAKEVAKAAEASGSNAIRGVKAAPTVLPPKAIASEEIGAARTTAASSHGAMPEIDIRATLDRAQMVHVSTAKLEWLQLELRSCIDPERRAELLRMLHSEQETVAIRTAIEARRLDQEAARAAAARRDEFARSFGAAMLSGMQQRGTFGSGFEVRADSTSIGRPTAEISSSPPTSTAAPQQTTTQPERPLTAPPKPIAEAIRSSIVQPSDLPAAVSWPANTTVWEQADRAPAPARAGTGASPSSIRSPLPIPPVAIGDAATTGRVENSARVPSPATQLRTSNVSTEGSENIDVPSLKVEANSSCGVSPGDFIEVVSYAGALFKLGCLTSDAQEAFGSMLGISAERLRKFAQQNVPGGSPQKAIQTAIAGAVARNDAWLAGLYEAFDPKPAELTPVRVPSRGFDMTD